MADTKLTALTETTSPATSDDVYIVTTPGGTPASKRCTIANLKTSMQSFAATDTIYDAAGDIVVGTGADAAGKLAKGANKTVLTAGASTLAYAFPPGYEFDYVEKTTSTSITATSEGTANTVLTSNAISLDGSTIVMIDAWAYGVTKGTGAIYIILVEDSTVLGTDAIVVSNASPCSIRLRRTPSNASHTYYLKAYVDAGTGAISAGAGGSGNYLPCFLRVTKAA